MKNIFKKSFVLFLTFLFAIGLTACSEEANVIKFLNYANTNYSFDGDVDGIVCENNSWALIWDDQNKRVSFLDKHTNILWGQTPREVIEKQNQTGTVLPQLNSAITVAYQDPTSLDEIYLYSYESAYQNGEITVKRIENGIRVIYDFSEFEFAIPVEYTINDETFDIKITPAHIAHGDEYKVSSIKVAPFTCGVNNDAKDSWLFIPDGSGAIVEPFVSDTLGAFGELEVYGHDLTTQLYGYGNKKQQVNMPVFGVKKGNNALFAIIDSGAAAASINWELGSETFGCSTVYPSFRIRGTNLIERPGNFISITTLSEINVFTDGVMLEDIRIKYYPLSDNNATITGMANCYRDYLVEKSGLTQSNQPEKTASFKVVGGTVQPEFILGIPSEKLFSLTTTEQTIKIAKELQKELGSNIMFDLVGYGKSGVDVGQVAGGFTTASSLGGNSGMKKLNKYFKENGITSYMDFDLIAFSKSGSGFYKNSSAIYDGGQLVTFTSFNTLSHVRNNDRFYVLSRKNLLKAANMLIEKAEKMDLSGISLSSVSNTSYSDHVSQEYYAGGKIATDVAGIFANVKNAGYNALSSSANIYAAVNSNEIIDVPLYSSNFNFTSYDVPFYQMVLKGYIPMSSVSLNLCSDQKDALLRCVSAGISPSYTLIHNFDNTLITSDHAFIPSSVYSSNKERILNDVDAVSSYLKTVDGTEIIEYTVLADEVVLTKFANGVWTVVNYSETDIECEYGKVSAQNFLSGREE